MKVKVKIVPSMNLWLDGELNVGQIKQIKIEDLLERAPIELENPDIKRELLGEGCLYYGCCRINRVRDSSSNRCSARQRS